jgi:hypothetical protein
LAPHHKRRKGGALPKCNAPYGVAQCHGVAALRLIALCVATAGIMATPPLFWNLPTALFNARLLVAYERCNDIAV